MDNIEIKINKQKLIHALINAVDEHWNYYLVELIYEKNTNYQYAVGISHQRAVFFNKNLERQKPVYTTTYSWFFEEKMISEKILKKRDINKPKIILVINLDKNNLMESFVDAIEQLKDKYEYTPKIEL